VIIPIDDLRVLHWIAKESGLPEYQVRRARMVLAVAAGKRIFQVAAEVGCDKATIWRICRRYEHRGLSGLLADDRAASRRAS
jgi:transposase